MRRLYPVFISLSLVVCLILPLLTPSTISHAQTALNVPLTITNPTAAVRTEPVTSGVPLPQHLNITDPASLRLVDANGSPLQAQFTPLARWGGAPDDMTKPIRWLLLDFLATVPPHETITVYLQEGGIRPALISALAVTETDQAVIIDTGAGQFNINKADGTLAGPEILIPMFGRAYVGNNVYNTNVVPAESPVTVEVALAGPLRASVHIKGSYWDSAGNSLLDYTTRYWFYAGQPYTRFFHTLENNTPCPLQDDGQITCHAIGSAGSVQIDELALQLVTNVPQHAGATPTAIIGGENQPVTTPLNGYLRLYQDSSGGDNWYRYTAMQDWEGNALDARPRLQAYAHFYGYQTTLTDFDTNVPGLLEEGRRSPGWLTFQEGARSFSVGVRDFWQNFPKSLTADPWGGIHIGLLPPEFGDADFSYTLRAGEHKTHEVWLGAGSLPDFNQPLFAQASPEWTITSGAFGLTAPISADWPDYEDYIHDQLNTSPAYDPGYMDWYPNLFAALEGADFYGMFDYGDWPLDYEAFGVAPLNVKYDHDRGLWTQWARGHDPRLFTLAEAAARHTADIDILHTLHEPRHWSDGIAFGHSYHDEEGFLNPHRNEGGTHPDTAYGLHGLLLAYYLTGYEKAWESALELADCIEYRVRNDINLWEFTSGETNGEGYALSPGLWDSGSRPAANNLSMLTAAYRATGDRRYLAASDALLYYAQPGNQPYINGPTGDSSEGALVKPWQLNMVLRALSEFNEMRLEFGYPDDHDIAGHYLGYADWLRDYVLLDLEPIDTGPPGSGARAAYPYEWFFDGRQGDPTDEWSTGNNVPSINNWLLLGADAMAYAYHLSGDPAYLDVATRLFRTGSRDPFYPDDANTYSFTKETVNAVSFGHIFLYEWARAQ